MKHLCALFVITLFLTATHIAAQSITKFNYDIESKSMSANLDNMLHRTMYDENIKGKIINITGNVFSAVLEAEGTYISFRGDTCRIIIEKQLGFLGWPGQSQIQKRCKVKPTRIGT
jgi:hypothetical protein